MGQKKIKKAGQAVSKGEKKPDGQVKVGHYESVNVGVIRSNGDIATIFPMNIQKNKKGKIINECKQIKRTNKIKGINRCSKWYFN